MPQGVFIPADQEHPLERRDVHALDDYRATVGRNIEAVDLPEAEATLFINEEGWLRLLPVNARATLLWWLWVPAARRARSVLLGDAILVGASDRRGEESDVPEDLAASLLYPHGHGIELRVPGGSRWHPVPAHFPSYHQAVAQAISLIDEWQPVEHVRIVRLAKQAGTSSEIEGDAS